MAYSPSLDSTNAILTLDQAKHFLGETGTGNDVTITSMVNMVSWKLNSLLNREVLARNQTEYHDGNGGIELWLRHPPVSGVTLYQDAAYAFGTDTIIASGDYVCWSDTGQIVLTGNIFLNGPKVIYATYSGGWAAASIPWEIQGAAWEMLTKSYDLQEHRSWATTSRSNDLGGMTAYNYQELESVKLAIAKYRKWVVS